MADWYDIPVFSIEGVWMAGDGDQKSGIRGDTSQIIDSREMGKLVRWSESRGRFMAAIS